MSIDWRIDPPPDLVLEIDIASYSDVNDYLPYRVPEVWLYKRQQFQIYQLQENAYHLSDQSRYFPARPSAASRSLLAICLRSQHQQRDPCSETTVSE